MEENKTNNPVEAKVDQAKADLQAQMNDPELQKLMKEETVQSPGITILKTFLSNRLSVIALGVFFFIFALVLIGPLFYPVDLSFVETTQQNIAPGQNMMAIPAALQKADNLTDLSVGRSFAVGLDKDGKVHVWGETNVPGADILKKMPKDVPQMKAISAGFDHVAGITKDGKYFGWGNNRQKQSKANADVRKVNNFVKVLAYHQFTLLLDADGNSNYLGNTHMVDYNHYHEYQGQLKDIALTSDAAIGLLKDGTPVYLGTIDSAYQKIPEGVKLTKIVASSKAVAGITEEGKVVVWGNLSSKGEGNVPEEYRNGSDKKAEHKVVDLHAGQFHFIATLDNGDTVSWGDNTYKQLATVNGVERVYTGYYQNYFVTKDGSVKTTGLKGYILGSDEFGRDVWQRMLNGGRWTMTIGAVAVLISTIIGIIIGGISGYFGGAVDIILQRIAEIVGSLPFLPFAIILNAIIGNKMSPTQRVYLIMIVLGLLSWTGLQALVRAQVFSVREQEYVTAARSLGIKESSIISRHIIPNVISIIIVSTTLSFASSMLSESSLSFLGFGVQPPIPTWGNMLFGANNSVVIQSFWWRWVFPAIALALTVISINLIGDGLRDAIDPKSQDR
ncbi:ABC transporter permease subunit [Guggenheimella bovis]